MDRAACLKWLTLATLLIGCNSQRPGAHGPTIPVDDANFDQVVLQADKPVLVDFWATWCGPCQVIAPMVSELAAEYEGRALVAKLDTDVAGATASKYGIEAIPTLIVFRNGREVSRVVGAVSKAELAQRLDAALQ